jgi:hypothetical protein
MALLSYFRFFRATAATHKRNDVSGYLGMARQVEARLRAESRLLPMPPPDSGPAVLPAPSTAPASPAPSALPPEPLSAWTDWPAALPGLGPKRVIPYARCAACVAEGGRSITESVTLLSGEVITWSVLVYEFTFSAYGERPLCLAHARHRPAP